MLTREDSDQDEKDEQDEKKRKRTVFYALMFEYEFNSPNQTVYFAFSQPYTYT